MKRVLSMVMVILLLLVSGMSASAEIVVSEYLKDMSQATITPFDTSAPSKKWGWSSGVYVGSLIGIKNWTYTQYTFQPNSSGTIHVMLTCGSGMKNETFKISLYDADKKAFVKSISFTGDQNGAVYRGKDKFIGLDTSKRYYLKFQHYSGNPCLSGSFLYVNNSSTFNI